MRKDGSKDHKGGGERVPVRWHSLFGREGSTGEGGKKKAGQSLISRNCILKKGEMVQGRKKTRLGIKGVRKGKKRRQGGIGKKKRLAGAKKKLETRV